MIFATAGMWTIFSLSVVAKLEAKTTSARTQQLSKAMESYRISKRERE